jgi:protein TonB
MQFSHTNEGSAKTGKFMLVAALHVAIGALFIHSMHSRHLSLSKINEQVLVMLDPQPVDPPPPPPPPLPPMPPQSMPKIVPPTLVAPEPEVPVVAPPPDAAPVHATPTPDAAPTAAGPAHALPDAAPGAQAKAVPSQARTAVLADPKACALPDYPARAARDGTTGTTLLALLVGADGRVSAASGSAWAGPAAVHALSLCKFKPATNNGVAEAGWAQLAYVWTLD